MSFRPQAKRFLLIKKARLLIEWLFNLAACDGDSIICNFILIELETKDDFTIIPTQLIKVVLFTKHIRSVDSFK